MSISRKKVLTNTLKVAANIAGAVILYRGLEKHFNHLNDLDMRGANFEAMSIKLSGDLTVAYAKLNYLDGYLGEALTEDQYNHLKNCGYL